METPGKLPIMPNYELQKLSISKNTTDEELPDGYKADLPSGTLLRSIAKGIVLSRSQMLWVLSAIVFLTLSLLIIEITRNNISSLKLNLWFSVGLLEAVACYKNALNEKLKK